MGLFPRAIRLFHAGSRIARNHFKKNSEKALPKKAFGLNSLAMVEILRSNVKKLTISFLHV
jgi:hypothetical protein